MKELLEDILKAMIDLSNYGNDTCWIGDIETVFDRLGTIYLEHGGDRETLKKQFPQYFD